MSFTGGGSAISSAVFTTAKASSTNPAVSCPWRHQFSAVAEAHEEEFGSWNRRLKKLLDRGVGLIYAGPHAEAGVENDAHGNRTILHREGGNLLLYIVFKDPERGLRQAHNGAITHIGDTDRHLNKFDIKPARSVRKGSGYRPRAELWRLSAHTRRIGRPQALFQATHRKAGGADAHYKTS
jgi:hypothetical protein